MMELLIDEIVRATEGKLIKGNLKDKVMGISTDSRKVKKDELFIPLKGEKYDGEDFVKDAIDKGASAVITARLDNVECLKDFSVNVIYVNETLEALHKIASYYRKKFNIPFIAVTGSS